MSHVQNRTTKTQITSCTDRKSDRNHNTCEACGSRRRLSGPRRRRAAPATSRPPRWPVMLVDPPLKNLICVKRRENIHIFFFKSSSVEPCTFIILQSEAQTPNWRNKRTKTCFLTGGDFKNHAGRVEAPLCSHSLQPSRVLSEMGLYVTCTDPVSTSIRNDTNVCVGSRLVKWIWEFLCIFYALLCIREPL